MPRPPPHRTILLRSADGRDVLRVTALRRDTGYPSVEVRVEGTAKGFSGGNDAWLDGFELKAFAAALRSFERSRHGRVELRSMSPEELRLVLRSADAAGHLLVEFTIARNALVADGLEPVPLRVQGAFELDPGTLGEIAEGVAWLASGGGA
ncbi:MAG TPA: hypothetical protein VF841_00140 [Anaeromyxobacter sp.]